MLVKWIKQSMGPFIETLINVIETLITFLKKNTDSRHKARPSMHYHTDTDYKSVCCFSWWTGCKPTVNPFLYPVKVTMKQYQLLNLASVSHSIWWLHMLPKRVRGYAETISGKGLVSLNSFFWTNAHGRLLKSQDICPKMFDLKMVALCLACGPYSVIRMIFIH